MKSGVDSAWRHKHDVIAVPYYDTDGGYYIVCLWPIQNVHYKALDDAEEDYYENEEYQRDKGRQYPKKALSDILRLPKRKSRWEKR